MNIGEAAGQTIPHLHVHLIPRYSGDVPDPTGGVRYIIPNKANYISESLPAHEFDNIVPQRQSGGQIVRWGDSDPTTYNTIAVCCKPHQLRY